MRMALCIYVYMCGLICHCVNSCCTTTRSAIVMFYFYKNAVTVNSMWPQTQWVRLSFIYFLSLFFPLFFYLKGSSTIPISVYYCCFGRPLLLSLLWYSRSILTHFCQIDYYRILRTNVTINCNLLVINLLIFFFFFFVVVSFLYNHIDWNIIAFL